MRRTVWRVVGWIGAIVVALIATAVIAWLTWVDYVATAGTSAWPGLGDGAWVVVNRRAKIERGDLVLVKTDEGHAIRRVIAMPGETITVVDSKPTIPGVEISHQELGLVKASTDKRIYRIVRETIAGRSWEIMDDTYREIRGRFEGEAGTGYLVLSDNREHGADSRRWKSIPRDEIRGVVWIVIGDGEKPWTPVEPD